LAAFLRSRRERLAPAAVGLPSTGRRRTPGLRREEVAQVAGVGVTWYTWLEQGRQIDVSVHFLEQIARALRLDGNERAHLFALAQNRPPPEFPPLDYAVTPPLRRMLEAFEGPAYIATASLDVVAWNTALSAVFGDLEQAPQSDRNMLWMMFASPAHRAVIPDWETTAKAMLARFRVEFGRHQNDAQFAAIIERVRRASHEFDVWWREHNVSWETEAPKRFTAPGVGEMALEQKTFLLEDAPMMRLVVYSPAGPASREKVMSLRAAWEKQRAQDA
jgi:transcriptional regulator with XRE-family HTH domain